MSKKKVNRPATPNLDMLDMLSETVYFPAGHGVLKQAGINVQGDQLVRALEIGEAVNMKVAEAQAKIASGEETFDAHCDKVAAKLGLETGENDLSGMIVAVDDIAAKNPDVAEKFAAALG